MGNFSITISGHSAFITSKLWRFNNEIEYANVGGVDHVAVAFYVDSFLQSYFDDDEEVINAFLKDFLELFADGQKRKLVLEVNSSNEDLLSIVNDLSSAGVEFV